MPIEATKGAWDASIQFGAVGAICFFAVAGLIWFVVSMKRDLKESNTKVISLLETTVKESTASNNNLAEAINGLPCHHFQVPHDPPIPPKRSSGGHRIAGIGQQE